MSRGFAHVGYAHRQRKTVDYSLDQIVLVGSGLLLLATVPALLRRRRKRISAGRFLLFLPEVRLKALDSQPRMGLLRVRARVAPPLGPPNEHLDAAAVSTWIAREAEGLHRGRRTVRGVRRIFPHFDVSGYPSGTSHDVAEEWRTRAGTLIRFSSPVRVIDANVERVELDLGQRVTVMAQAVVPAGEMVSIWGVHRRTEEGIEISGVGARAVRSTLTEHKDAMAARIFMFVSAREDIHDWLGESGLDLNHADLADALESEAEKGHIKRRAPT